MRDDEEVAQLRGRQTVRDMILSMTVIGLLSGFVYLFIPHDDSEDPVKTVSYRVEANAARRAAPYPVAVPQGLPAQWRATSVRYQAQSKLGSAWHLGFISPQREYAAVEQSDGKPAHFIDDVTHQAQPTDTAQTVDGRKWLRYEGPKYRALVLREPGVTTVVTGTAPFRQLGTLAAALKSERG